MNDWVLQGWAKHLGAAVDVERLTLELSAGSLPEAFNRTARAVPSQTALRIDDEEICHGALDDAASRIAGWLQSEGVAAGERVLLSGRNSVSFVSTYLGALRAGATVIPTSPSLTEPELAALVALSGVNVAFADAPVADKLRACMNGSIVQLDHESPDLGGILLSAVIAQGKPSAVGPIASDSTAILAFTSGTTGMPKGVPLSHGNLLASIRSVMWAWRWSADDVLIHALPLTHQHGLGGVHATLLSGSRGAFQSRFEPAQLVALADEVGATVLFAVPAMYERLLESTVDLEPLRRLRLAVSGSAPLSPELAHRIADALGHLPLERYGTTESGLDISNPYDGPRVVGSVGLPLPGVEVMIADDSGQALPTGQPGEILLRGPQVFDGYLNSVADSKSSFHDTWFRTGDIGRLEPANSYLEITGRIKELIISGGLNVTPREVELVLEQHEAVNEAAVGGLPSKEWGEVVAAWVVTRPGLDLDVDELLAYARTHLAAYKCPKRVFVVDALPRNSLGKLLRRSLRAP